MLLKEIAEILHQVSDEKQAEQPIFLTFKVHGIPGLNQLLHLQHHRKHHRRRKVKMQDYYLYIGCDVVNSNQWRHNSDRTFVIRGLQYIDIDYLKPIAPSIERIAVFPHSIS